MPRNGLTTDQLATHPLLARSYQPRIGPATANLRLDSFLANANCALAKAQAQLEAITNQLNELPSAQIVRDRCR